MTRATICLLLVAIASSSYSQSALLKRGTSAFGAALAFSTDPDTYSIGGSVSLALAGRVDVGYSHAGLKLDNGNTVSSDAFAISLLVSRGDERPHRLFFALNYGMAFSAYTYKGMGLDPNGQPARDYDGPKTKSHLVGATIGTLPPVETRPAFVWSIDVSRTIPVAEANQFIAPKGFYVFSYSLGLVIPIAGTSMIVPVASISRGNETTSFTFAANLVFDLTD